jgi:hypothetical protein
MLKIVTVRSALGLLTKVHEFGSFMMYRGQGDATWHLLPSIGRMFRYLKDYDGWDILEEDLIERFKRYSLPYLESKPGNQFDWLIMAQHYGLPTRLLDWTTNPLKGLFFAVENPSRRVDGALWALEPDGWYHDLTKIDKIKGGRLDFLAAYFPAHLDIRIIAQESCFTFFPFPDSKTRVPPLERVGYYKKDVVRLVKFLIPKDAKKACRAELQKLGITHRSLFPDLEGLAKSIRREFDLPW